VREKMDKLLFFLLNVFLSSFLTFSTTIFLIEILTFILRVPKGRWASFLRMIPFLKLPLDLFLYDFSRWSFTHSISPLLCEEGSRTLSIFISSLSKTFPLPLSRIEFITKENFSFTIADLTFKRQQQ
jgi:hypothetical protein